MHWTDSCCVDYWLTTDTVLLNLCTNARSNYKLLYGFLKVTMRTEPLFCCWRSAKANALQMKPLNGTVIPITPEPHPHPGRSISRKFLVFPQGPVQEINVKSLYFPHYCSVKSPLSAGVWGSCKRVNTLILRRETT